MTDQARIGEGAPEDMGELYALHARRLRQIVRVGIRAPEPLIEDACQVAWTRLLRHRGSIRREAALAWLVTTASREALRLIRRSARELSLEELGEATPAPAGTAPDELVEWRCRLERIRDLPARQQQLVWLQGLGLSYAEMSGYTGASRRTVERQLLRAKRALRSE